MDYKYIEQLLDCYWRCETSLEEEKILRTFFRQEEIPAHLLPYQDLFHYEEEQQQAKLSNDFDARIMKKISRPVVQATRRTFISQLRPLFRAAAIVIIVLSIGSAIQYSLGMTDKSDYNYDSYVDTYNDPQVAYDEVSSALMMLSEGINKSQILQKSDTAQAILTDDNNSLITK